MKIISALLLLGVLFTAGFAQRPRTADTSQPQPQPQSQPQKPATRAPKSMNAKYEGGVFGYTKTMEGTLSFDDENGRLFFKDKKGAKEISIPYEALTSAFGDTKKVQPAAATVAGNVPSLYALPARFVKHKVRYLTLQYSDPDSKMSGITSFKLDNKELLDSVLAALAEKAGMTLRGDVYVKKKAEDSSKATP